MGNELNTVGGAVATAATSVAAGVTLGQVEALNDAVVECAKFTTDAASKTVVRHVGETVGKAAATGALAVAAGVTLGQVDELNEVVTDLAKNTADAAAKSGKVIKESAEQLANGVPVVGHIKGGIHFAIGDMEGAERAMKSANRTSGFIAGGILGAPVGPAGMIAGGLAGAAAADGITTGVETAVNGKYTPSGQIKAWTKTLTKGENASPGVVVDAEDGLMIPVGGGEEEESGSPNGEENPTGSGDAVEETRDSNGFDEAGGSVPENNTPASVGSQCEEDANRAAASVHGFPVAELKIDSKGSEFLKESAPEDGSPAASRSVMECKIESTGESVPKNENPASVCGTTEEEKATTSSELPNESIETDGNPSENQAVSETQEESNGYNGMKESVPSEDIPALNQSLTVTEAQAACEVVQKSSSHVLDEQDVTSRSSELSHKPLQKNENDVADMNMTRATNITDRANDKECVPSGSGVSSTVSNDIAEEKIDSSGSEIANESVQSNSNPALNESKGEEKQEDANERSNETVEETVADVTEDNAKDQSIDEEEKAICPEVSANDPSGMSQEKTKSSEHSHKPLQKNENDINSTRATNISDRANDKECVPSGSGVSSTVSNGMAEEKIDSNGSAIANESVQSTSNPTLNESKGEEKQEDANGRSNETVEETVAETVADVTEDNAKDRSIDEEEKVICPAVSANDPSGMSQEMTVTKGPEIANDSVPRSTDPTLNASVVHKEPEAEVREDESRSRGPDESSSGPDGMVEEATDLNVPEVEIESTQSNSNPALDKLMVEALPVANEKSCETVEETVPLHVSEEDSAKNRSIDEESRPCESEVSPNGPGDTAEEKFNYSGPEFAKESISNDSNPALNELLVGEDRQEANEGSSVVFEETDATDMPNGDGSADLLNGGKSRPMEFVKKSPTGPGEAVLHSSSSEPHNLFLND